MVEGVVMTICRFHKDARNSDTEGAYLAWQSLYEAMEMLSTIKTEDMSQHIRSLREIGSDLEDKFNVETVM